MEVVDIDEFMISMLSFMHEDENVSDFEAETSFVQSMCSDPEMEVTWCSSSGSICSTKEYSSSINPSPPQEITSYEVNSSSISECSFLTETEPAPRAASTPTMPRKVPLSLNKLWRILEGLERSQATQEESVQQQEHPVSRSYDLEVCMGMYSMFSKHETAFGSSIRVIFKNETYAGPNFKGGLLFNYVTFFP
ncbi:unnamed protein product [Acanthoscelides obtectus]|uniref:Uncharacterized protein n=1 Tax=Acanthoscelides obtectus TaxID=200917 RepID=A0A9P0KGM0_ACAOB|nr:unnamed protein product [Acanthoscelides obtectus]CAK1674877.1 hypothetical protein AOBTE_LOCUS29793 [Acanthoscelides obtectus]